jgi:hypothetical protein
MPAPFLSIIVNFHNMRREAARTLLTLSRPYQQRIADLSYEVIAIDNGSTEPLAPAFVRSFGPEFRHEFFATTSHSPVAALNHGASLARAPHLMMVIDGAHLLSPGILAYTAAAFRAMQNAFVATLPLHLGPGLQNVTSTQGYNQAAEDAMLARLDWQRDGYELFRIAGSTSDGSMGWFGALFESNCFALPTAAFHRLEGFHPGFASRGGGLANLDFFRNAVESPDLAYTLLFGEATFHQYHGGVTTNVAPQIHPWEAFHHEYVGLRNKPYARPTRMPTFLGSLPPQAFDWAEQSLKIALPWRKQHAPR